MNEDGLDLAPESRALQTALSDVNERFLLHVRAHPELLQRSSFHPLEEPSPLFSWRQQSWPLFVDASAAEEMTRAARDVFDAGRRCLARLAATEASAFLERYPNCGAPFPLPLIELEATAHIISRQDLILTSGGPKVLECNSLGALGGWEACFAVERYLRCPPIREFLSGCDGVGYVNTLAAVLEHILLTTGDKLGVPFEDINLCLLTPEAPPAQTEMMRGALQWQLDAVSARLGHAATGGVIICTPDDLNSAGGQVMVGERRVHALVDRDRVRIPRAAVDAAVEGGVMLYNGPAGDALGRKDTLALLSEACDEGELAEEDTTIVRAFVPWTRELDERETVRDGVRVNLVDHALTHRGELVLKPATGVEGRGVLLGVEATAESWEESIRGAITDPFGPWVLQERVEGLSAMMQRGQEGASPHRVVAGAFVLGKRDGGLIFRMSAKEEGSVINAATGATVTVPFVPLEPKLGYPLTEISDEL